MNFILKPEQKVVVTDSNVGTDRSSAPVADRGASDAAVSQRLVVERFYNLQNDKRWDEAYALLSANLRDTAAFSHPKFIDDRRDTTSIYVKNLRVDGDRVYVAVHWEKPGSILNLDGYWVVQKEDGAWKLDDFLFKKI